MGCKEIKHLKKDFEIYKIKKHLYPEKERIDIYSKLKYKLAVLITNPNVCKQCKNELFELKQAFLFN